MTAGTDTGTGTGAATDTGTGDTVKRAGRQDARLPMTPARRLILAVGLPVLAVLIGWTALNIVAGAGTGSYQFSRALPVTGGTLTAHLGEGSVTLVPGPSARLAGTITYSLIRPGLTVTGSEVSYHCRIPAGRCSLVSTLTIPPATGVNLSSGAGDLTVNGTLGGDITLSTSAGDLTANGLAGTGASLTTTTGDVTASAVTAAVVAVTSVTGNVTLTFTWVPDKVTVTSTAGDVSIVLPAGPDRYRIDASSGIGDTSVSPGVVQDFSSSHVIQVHSTTGNIAITTS